MSIARWASPKLKLLSSKLFPVAVLLAVWTVYIYYSILSRQSKIVAAGIASNEKWKTITWYKLFHGGLRMNAKSVHMEKCEYKHCSINFIDNQDDVNDYYSMADAVIFQGGRLPSKPPERAHSNQVYLFSTIESPVHLVHSVPGQLWRNMINWTMTYRLDSDILYKYGAMAAKTGQQLADAQATDFHKIYRQKTKQVAWLVSDCTTEGRRENYVKILQKHIKVDVYGRCGSFKNCTKDEGVKCMNKIAKDYKFYLSFENSICTDYMTEKVFTWFQMPIVNVVRGARSYGNLLPANTYVDTHKFAKIEHLARYLKELGSNEEKYVQFLRNKAIYETESLLDQVQAAYCELCKRLHNLGDYKRMYPQINTWWYQNTCLRSVKDLV